MILAIDIGNTRIKAAVFEQFTALEFFVFEKNTFEKNIAVVLKKFPSIQKIVIASVTDAEKLALEKFSSSLKIHFINRQDFFPFTNNYQSPETLGIDRMVLASGATLIYPNCARLIIDAGTCVTYDFVDEANVYHGGAISAGLQLRYKALHNYTAKLPLLQTANPEAFIGNSTTNAIHSGVVNGLVYEIEGFIEEYSAVYPKFIIILTGGDADFLAKRLKNTIFANSNFLLESLNQTYQYISNND